MFRIKLKTANETAAGYVGYISSNWSYSFFEGVSRISQIAWFSTRSKMVIRWQSLYILVDFSKPVIGRG